MRKLGLAPWCVALLALGSPSAIAGERTPPLPPIPPVVVEPPLPIYQDNLEQLAEVMGTLAFMRDLCGASAGADWREKMAALLATEGVTAERRARLAGRFNRGYEGYRLTYRRCTPAADTVIARSLDKGASLSNALARQFSAQ